MKFIFNISIALITLASCMTNVSAQNRALSLDNGTIKNCGHHAYQGGESLTYTVKYGFITGGHGYFTVRDTMLNGVKTNHVTVRGETAGIVDVLYKVRDSYESFIDPTTQMPIKAIRDIREGGYTKYEEVKYNRIDSTVNAEKTRNGQYSQWIEEVPAYTLDMVSAFYHGRNNSFNDDLVVGDTIKYTTYFGSKVYPLIIRYLGRETVSTAMGKIECYKFCPVTEEGRSFKTKDAMQVWISCDENRIPIKIKFNLLVGSFVCELTKYEGIKYNMKMS